MNLLVVGVNHKTAPVELREKLAVQPSKLEEVLNSLRRLAGIQEAVVLSTCNRVEIYAASSEVEASEDTLRKFLAQHLGIADLGRAIYAYRDSDTVRHLFRVATGLDSMVVGENEILGQVKFAYQAALNVQTTGKLTNILFQRSLYVGKTIRTHTALSQGATSVGGVAVLLAERIFGSLQETPVMIVGAGKMAEVAVRHLASQKVPCVLVANRTFERAQELARQIGGEAIRFEEALERLGQVDIVITSTACPVAFITAEHVKKAFPFRHGRSLFFIDIAVPRNVDPAIHGLDNVYVYNVDDLQAIVAENVAKRSQEIHRAESLLENHLQEFAQWYTRWRSGEQFGMTHAAHKVHRDADSPVRHS